MIDPKILETYADLVVTTGVNLRAGQCLLVNTAHGTYEFARLIAKCAYVRGAKFVRINIIDNQLVRYRIEAANLEDLDWLPNYVTTESHEYLATDWARIRIDSTEELETLKGVDASLIARVQTAQRSALRRQQEALMRDQHSWLVIAAPGPRWARHVFRHSGPEYRDLAENLSDEAITDRLWLELRKILRLDQADPVQAWKDHAAALQERCRKLDALRLAGLRFVNADTDLYVGLNPTSIWHGGGAVLPDGRAFMPNLPTEEVFTTPDFSQTRGRVKAIRPVSVMESLVQEAWFEFEKGKIVRCGAKTGQDLLEKYIAIDEGAAFLGEVALVAAESPIFSSGLLFGSILYDENASCHIAIGAGYPSCLSNAAQLVSPAAVKAAGCNVSLVHTDFMIGTPTTDVTGIGGDGREIPIIRQGSFVI